MTAESSYHHGNLASALTKAAVKQVCNEGASSLSLRQIARTLGVTAPAVYRHFANREELLDVVVLFGYDELTRLVLLHITDKQGKKRFVGTALGYIAFAEQYPRLFLLMFGSDGASGREKLQRDERRVPLENRIRTALNEYLDKTPSNTSVLQAWAVAHGFASLDIH